MWFWIWRTCQSIKCGKQQQAWLALDGRIDGWMAYSRTHAKISIRIRIVVFLRCDTHAPEYTCTQTEQVWRARTKITLRATHNGISCDFRCHSSVDMKADDNAYLLISCPYHLIQQFTDAYGVVLCRVDCVQALSATSKRQDRRPDLYCVLRAVLVPQKDVSFHASNDWTGWGSKHKTISCRVSIKALDENFVRYKSTFPCERISNGMFVVFFHRIIVLQQDSQNERKTEYQLRQIVKRKWEIFVFFIVIATLVRSIGYGMNGIPFSSSPIKQTVSDVVKFWSIDDGHVLHGKGEMSSLLSQRMGRFVNTESIEHEMNTKYFQFERWQFS